jgi:hypothetical protein
VNKGQYLWATSLSLNKSFEVAFRTLHWEMSHFHHQKISVASASRN